MRCRHYIQWCTGTEDWLMDGTKVTLHFIAFAHSLNPRYYSAVWRNESPNHVASYKDVEISAERNKWLKRYFENYEERKMVIVEFAKFLAALDQFADSDSLQHKGAIDPLCWWLYYGSQNSDLSYKVTWAALFVVFLPENIWKASIRCGMLMGDALDSFEGAGLLENADISLAGPGLEAIIRADWSDENDGLPACHCRLVVGCN